MNDELTPQAQQLLDDPEFHAFVQQRRGGTAGELPAETSTPAASGLTPEAQGLMNDPEFHAFVQQHKGGVAAKPQEPPDTGGFWAGAKSMAGETAKGFGQFGADYIPGVTQDNALKKWGQEVVDANPTPQGLQGWKEHPLDSALSFAGGMAAGVGTAGAIAKFGQGIAKLPVPGPYGLATKAIGHGLTVAAPYIAFGAPAQASIREQQMHDDPNSATSMGDKLLATAGAGTVGAITHHVGPQGRLGMPLLTAAGRSKLGASLTAENLVGNVAKGAGMGAGQALLAAPVEQAASYHNPFTPDNLLQTAEGAASAALGGGIVGGAMHAGNRALRGKGGVNDTSTPKDLLNPSLPAEAPRGTQGELLGEGGGKLPDQMTPGYNDVRAVDPAAVRSRWEELRADREDLQRLVQERYSLPKTDEQAGLMLDPAKAQEAQAAEQRRAAMVAQAMEHIRVIDAEMRALSDGQPMAAAYQGFNPAQGDLFAGTGDAPRAPLADRAAAYAAQVAKDPAPAVKVAPTKKAAPAVQAPVAGEKRVFTGRATLPADVAAEGAAAAKAFAAKGKAEAPAKPVSPHDEVIQGADVPDAKRAAMYTQKGAVVKHINDFLNSRAAETDNDLATWHKAAVEGNANKPGSVKGAEWKIPLVEAMLTQRGVQPLMTDAQAMKPATPNVPATPVDAALAKRNFGAKLTTNQQSVMDFVQTAIKEDRASEVIDAEGNWQVRKIATALGFKNPGSALDALNRVAANIAKAHGMTVDQFRASLKARGEANRAVESADAERLGLSPEQQSRTGIEGSELFGNAETGAEQHMGIIEGPGGSQTETQAHAAKPTREQLAKNKLAVSDVAPYLKDAPTQENAKAGEKEQRAAKAEENRRKKAAEAEAAIQRRIADDADRARLNADMAAKEGEHIPSLDNEFGKDAVDTATDEWNAYAHLQAKDGVGTPAFDTMPEAAQRQAVRLLNYWLGQKGRTKTGLYDLFDRVDHENDGREAVGGTPDDAADGRGRLAGGDAPRLEARVGEPARVGAPAKQESPQSNPRLGADEPRAAASPVGPEGSGVEAKGSKPVIEGEAARVTEAAKPEPAPSTEPQVERALQLLADMRGKKHDLSHVGELRDLLSSHPDVAEAVRERGMFKNMAELSDAIDVAVKDAEKRQPAPQETPVTKPAPEAAAPEAKSGVDNAPAERGVQRKRVVKVEKPEKPVAAVAPEEGPLFSKSGEALDPTDESGIRSAISTLAGRDTRGKITVFATAKDATEAGALTSKDTQGTQAWVKGGRAYFIAENIPKGHEMAVFLHEVGVHLGMENAIGPANYAKLHDQIDAWLTRGTGVEGEIAKAAMGRLESAQKDSSVLDARTKKDEMLAYFVEEAVKRGIDPTATRYNSELGRWFRMLWAGFKSAIRQLGFSDRSLTAQNMVDLAYGAARLELNGQFHATQDVFRKFVLDTQRAGMSNGLEEGLGVYVTDAKNSSKQWTDKGAGNIMHVDANVRDDHLLDWTSPQSYFSPFVSRALEKIKPTLQKAFAEYVSNGEGLYNNLVSYYLGDTRRLGNEEYFDAKKEAMRKTNNLLQSVGIEGILHSNPYYGKGTTTRVVFNDKNIQRVSTRVAGDDGRIKFSKAAPDIEAAKTPEQRKEADEFFTKQIDRIPNKALRDATGSTYFGVKDAVRNGLLGSAFVHDLIDHVVKLGMPAARKYQGEMEAKNRLAHVLSAPLQIIADKANALKTHELAKDGALSVNKFMSDMSYAGKWAWQLPADSPLWKGKQVSVDPALAARFRALSPAAQEVVKLAVDYGETMRQELAKVGVDIAVHDGPYLPHKRFGNWLSISKSAEYARREALEDGSHEALKDDPNHYHVSAFEGSWDARTFRNEQRKNAAFAGDNLDSRVYHTKAEEYFSQIQLAPMQQIARLESMINGDHGLSARQKTAIVSSLQNLYKQTLSNVSARHAEQRRANVAGADADMLRALFTQGHASASLVASLAHGKEIEQSITAMRDEANKNDRNGHLKEGLNELLKRHALSMLYRPTPIQNKIMALTAFQKVITSPAFFLQQTVEPFMMLAPVLAGRFNDYRGAMKEMGSAYAQAMQAIGLNPMHSGSAPDAVIAKLKGHKNSVGRDYDAIQELIETGRADLGNFNEFGNLGARADKPVAHAVNTVLSKVSRVATDMEEINRIASGLTAYRMMYKHLTAAGKGADAAHDEATAYATKMVDHSHGNYSAWASPRFMMQANSVVPIRVITQFRKFQVMQLSLLGRLTHGAFHADTPEAKAMARKALGYMTAQMAVVAGGLGVPMAGVASDIASLFLRDEDEPWGRDTTELHLRKLIGDPTLANLLLHGAPAAAGVDVSKRIGGGGMGDLAPYSELDVGSRKGFEGTLPKLLGPFIGGTLPATFDTYKLFRQGEYQKGMESLTPSMLTNISKAQRFAEQGVTNAKGDVLLKPGQLSSFDIASQALGLPSTHLTDRQFKQSVLMDQQAKWQELEERYTHQFVKASREKDSEAKAEAAQGYKAVQDAKRAAGGIGTPLSTLYKAPMEQIKRQVQNVGGVEVTKQTRGIMRRMEQQGV